MRLRPVIATSAILVLATGKAHAAEPVEIPLSFMRREQVRMDKAKFAEIAIADHDLMAPGAAPPQASLEAGTTDVVHGLTAQDSGSTVEGTDERRPRVAGRHCMPAMNGCFSLELTGTLATAKEAYVLVDYLDNMTSATQLELRYQSVAAPGEQGAYEMIPGPVFSGSGTWKRYQFHVPDPGFLRPSLGKSSRQFEFYPGRATPALGARSQEVLSAPPPGNWKLPTFQGPPTFVLADFAGRKCLFAFDRANAKDRFCSRLRFDANGDGDLTNDEAHETTPSSWEPPSGESWSAWFEIDTSVTLAGAARPYCFDVLLQGEARGVPLLSKLIPPDAKVTAIQFRAQCYYGGDFALGGKRYRISLSDSNTNTLFGEVPHANDRASTDTDPGAHYLGGDILTLTTGESLRAGEILTFSPYLHLEGTLFETELRLAEGKLLLKPTAEKLFPLQLAAPVRTITLVSDDYRHSVAALDPGEELSVPAGKYGFSQYSRVFTENAGTSWTLAATLARPVPTANVGPDSPNARLAFGEPYAPYVEAVPSPDEMKDPDVRKIRVELSFKVRGVAGETVKTPRRQGRGQTGVELSRIARFYPKEPEYRVATAEGELVTQGSFQYG